MQKIKNVSLGSVVNEKLKLSIEKMYIITGV